jgi:hypothetical protein
MPTVEELFDSPQPETHAQNPTITMARTKIPFSLLADDLDMSHVPPFVFIHPCA